MQSRTEKIIAEVARSILNIGQMGIPKFFEKPKFFSNPGESEKLMAGLREMDRDTRKQAALKGMLFLEVSTLPKDVAKTIAHQLYSISTRDCFFPLEKPGLNSKQEPEPEQNRYIT